MASKAIGYAAIAASIAPLAMAVIREALLPIV